jgi:putative NADPH-quinone reductase
VHERDSATQTFLGITAASRYSLSSRRPQEAFLVNILVIDGHPDENRLVTHLLDHYQHSLAPEITVTRITLRHLTFDLNLHRGYAAQQPWEPDLQLLGNAIATCDHLVIGFPLWWGSEPALLKGAIDRVILPGFAFRYRRDSVWWDRTLAGRSCDLIVTMDTPPWYLRLIYCDPVIRRWRGQILGFCGIKPVRAFRFGPTRRGAAQKHQSQWERRIARAAATASKLSRANKVYPTQSRSSYLASIADRQS